jgi:signal peptidase II
MRRNLITGTIIVIAIIALDTLAQAWVFSALQDNSRGVTVTPFFNLVEVWNHGVSFGMFNKLAYGKWLLSGMAIIVTIILLRWLYRTDDHLTAVALSLIIGGAIGNTIDRLRFGAVADYLDFHAYGYHWPAFNVTDSAIFIGVCLLVCYPSAQKDKAV